VTNHHQPTLATIVAPSLGCHFQLIVEAKALVRRFSAGGAPFRTITMDLGDNNDSTARKRG
jgi:hypothetical protein